MLMCCIFDMQSVDQKLYCVEINSLGLELGNIDQRNNYSSQFCVCCAKVNMVGRLQIKVSFPCNLLSAHFAKALLAV